MQDKYPYLGITSVEGKNCVVLFSSENYGTVVMSEMEDKPEYQFGLISEFNENEFEYLDTELVIRINN